MEKKYFQLPDYVSQNPFSTKRELVSYPVPIWNHTAPSGLEKSASPGAINSCQSQTRNH